MTRLGSNKRPAIVRVQTPERAEEITELFREHDWDFIVGVEPDKDEDITDLLKLLHPERFSVRALPTAGRNDPCPCGSGNKYKKCCLRTASAITAPSRQAQ
jgi:SWIM/SEC-C metal-binding protein